jgi:polyhydroxybutyrate depolymerase
VAARRNGGARRQRSPHRPTIALLVIVAALCGRAASAAGDAATAPPLHRMAIDHHGKPRSYLIPVPPGEDATPRPAVFVFHGGLGDGAKINAMTGFAAAAERHGFIAVFPQGGRDGGDYWNDGRETTASDKDDVDFVHAVIDQLANRRLIDRARLFAVGASNGGMFVYRLACEASATFAAFAAVIANLPTALAPRCRPARPVSMLIINGTDDPLMPWQGGEIRHLRWLGLGRGGQVLSTMQTLETWARLNGCATPSQRQPLPDKINDGTSVTRYQFDGCRDRVDLVLFAVEGGGHTWPGQAGERRRRLTGPTSHEIDATDVIVGFFRAHGLEAH